MTSILQRRETNAKFCHERGLDEKPANVLVWTTLYTYQIIGPHWENIRQKRGETRW